MKKIAFCFLIYDEILHEDIWYNFFKNVNPEVYRIYIHYKINKPLRYFENNKLKNCIATKYADVSLIHAHNLLFRQAYEDGCDKIISLSQSCIPFKPFIYTYSFLTKDDKAHFNKTDQIQCFPRCNELLNYYNKEDIQKSSNWFILNRAICEICIKNTNEIIQKEFANIRSPEEHYFIIQVYKNNLQNHVIFTDNLAENATTFTNWKGMDYKYVSTRGLKNYDFISEEELLYLINSKCLFGRKFTQKCHNSLFNPKYIKFILSDILTNNN